jgi:DNA repair protein RadD
MILRDYQAAAVDAAIHQLKTSRESSVMELATGAGKSLIVAKLAEWFNKTTGKKVLCLAPSKELVQQNHAKFLMTGSPASIYCASINKSLAHNVVFGSPQTVKNSLARFDDAFCLIIVDECHGITPSIKYIIEGMTGKQKNLRVIGLTATPYRMGDGYIYQYKLDGSPVPLEQTRDPYFNKLIVQVQAQTLIDQGYLTRPTTGETGEHYDTSELVGTVFDSHLVEKAFEGHGRLTSAIVADIVEQARYRKGVIIFCATVKHAIETLASLPPEISAMVTGETPKKEREKILSLFQKKQIKYLVNVAVLTTGFDAVHIDLVALMRATESAALMQQMIGRGLRLDEGKRDCLVLDYAGNIERHCPDGNLFNPKIKAMWKGEA